MSKAVVIFVLLAFSVHSFSDSESIDFTPEKKNYLSEFEVMLEGMKTCSGMRVYYDKKLQRSVHPYFIGKVPSYIDDEIVIYDIEEYYYGMKVTKITIPNSFPVVEIELDDSIEDVKYEINKIFNNGYYLEYPEVEDLDKPIVSKSRLDESKTTITCD